MNDYIWWRGRTAPRNTSRNYLCGWRHLFVVSLVLLSCVLFKKRQELFLSATQSNHYILMRLFSFMGANPNVLIPQEGPSNESVGPLPLLLELQCDHVDKRREANDARRMQNPNLIQKIDEVKAYENRINALLDAGAYPDAAFKSGMTALHMAIEYHQAAIAVSLIAHGANIDVRDKKGQTPLMFASHKGDQEMVALLLKNQADIHTVDIYGWTALMFAVAPGHENVVRLLLDNGADPTVKDKRGQTAYDHARYYPKVRSLLKAQEANSESNADQLVLIATISNRDEDCEKVSKALHAAGIPALIAGSLGYGVRVSQQHRERALEILKADARLYGY